LDFRTQLFVARNELTGPEHSITIFIGFKIGCMNRVAVVIIALFTVLIPVSALPQVARDATAQISAEDLPEAFVGDVYAVVGDSHNRATFYAATNGRGVFKTTDGGGRWRDISSGIPSRAHFHALVIDPFDSNILYAVGHSAICKTVNGGESWTPTTSSLSESGFYGFAIDPSHPSTLYVGTDHGVLRTTDSGQNWKAIGSQLTTRQVTTFLVDPSESRIIYAITPDGLLKSADLGANWISIDSGLPKKEIETITIVPSDSSVLYVGTLNHGIYKSTNGGKRWSTASSGLRQGGSPQREKEIPSVRALAIDPSDTKILYASVVMETSSGPHATLFKSTNSGASWKLLRVIGATLGFMNVYCLTIDPFAPATVYAGADGDGVYKSLDGGVNWSGEDAGLTTASIVTLAIGASDGTLYAGTEDGVFVLDGQSWRLIGSRHGDFGGEWVAYAAVDPSDSAKIYVGTRSSDASDHGGVFKSTNGGRSWSRADFGLRRFAAWILGHFQSNRTRYHRWRDHNYRQRRDRIPILQTHRHGSFAGYSLSGELNFCFTVCRHHQQPFQGDVDEQSERHTRHQRNCC
jgi:photosystem II stability/assembly factor-like uncharacterized protein